VLRIEAPVLTQAANVAITFDELPTNGGLAPHRTRAGIVAQVLANVKKELSP